MMRDGCCKRGGAVRRQILGALLGLTLGQKCSLETPQFYWTFQLLQQGLHTAVVAFFLSCSEMSAVAFSVGVSEEYIPERDDFTVVVCPS